MDGGGQYNPRTVEEVFRDFKGRRAGMVKALTTGLPLSLSNFLFSFSTFIFKFFLRFYFVMALKFFFYWLGVIFADVEEFYQQCDPG